MTNLVLITSANEGNKGIGVNDFNGSNLATNFKDCVADTGALCLVGGTSSFSGQGAAGDYVVAAQSKKPVINVYHWGKPQVHYQCHVQEITTAITADSSGTYLLGGTKRGWVYIWEISSGALLTSFQAHFKAVTHVKVTARSDFFVSASEDGMARCWDLCSIVGNAAAAAANSKRNAGVQPFRSWNPHTLAIKGMHIVECGSSVRVFTCSMDRNVVIHDIHTNKQCHRLAMPQALESLVCTAAGDYAFVGGSSGTVFVLDLSLTAAAKHATHASTATTSMSAQLHASGLHGAGTGTSTVGGDASMSTSVTNCLEGHSKAVVSLSIAADGRHLVSGSEDASVRIWDIDSLQCLHEIAQPRAVSNVLALRCPEMLQNATISRPKLAPFEHLKKYTDATKAKGVAAPGSFMLAPAVFGSTTDFSQTSGQDCATRETTEARLGASGGGGSADYEAESSDEDEEQAEAEAEAEAEEEEEEEEKVSGKANEKPTKKGRGKKRAADLTDSQDFLSFGNEPVTVMTKMKPKKTKK